MDKRDKIIYVATAIVLIGLTAISRFTTLPDLFIFTGIFITFPIILMVNYKRSNKDLLALLLLFLILFWSFFFQFSQLAFAGGGEYLTDDATYLKSEQKVLDGLAPPLIQFMGVILLSILRNAVALMVIPFVSIILLFLVLYKACKELKSNYQLFFGFMFLTFPIWNFFLAVDLKDAPFLLLATVFFYTLFTFWHKENDRHILNLKRLALIPVVLVLAFFIKSSLTLWLILFGLLFLVNKLFFRLDSRYLFFIYTFVSFFFIRFVGYSIWTHLRYLSAFLPFFFVLMLAKKQKKAEERVSLGVT